jgi:hypothetical protein
VHGVPAEITTSYAEDLSIQIACRGFTRLTNDFSKRLDQRRHEQATTLQAHRAGVLRVGEPTLDAQIGAPRTVFLYAWSPLPNLSTMRGSS